MAEPIAFYFDFSSPYGYLAALRIDELAAKHGRAVAWKPMLLGVSFKATGSEPLMNIPLKGDYSRRDLARTARLQGVPFAIPEPFPFMSVAACRAFYWLDDRDPGKARALAKALYRAAFAEGRVISDARGVIAVARALGIDGGALAAALEDPAIKQRLRDVVDDTVAREIFGSPYFVVDGEPFWGNDRLDQIDRWLETGGW